ncbi:MAG: hypothetical protein ABEK36_00555, partial [Candidatus Aenigmatarchaeota archaeon]
MMKKVINLIKKEWKPEKCFKEEGGHDDFKKDLESFLEEKIEDYVNIESKKDRVDIQIGKNIAVEVKRKMDNANMVKTAFSDVSEYNEDYSGIVVVICGGKKMYVKRLKKRIDNEIQTQNPIEVI